MLWQRVAQVVVAALVTAAAARVSTQGMVLVPAAQGFRVGADDDLGRDGESPSRLANVAAFYMDSMPVSNAEFRVFVRKTGYKTEAENFKWSFVFHLLVDEKVKRSITDKVKGMEWWLPVEGAYWRKPFGPGSTIKGRENYPATQISWNDAVAFCRWKGKRLPSEAEWELAAGGSSHRKDYPWGSKPDNGRMNTWHGKFPDSNTLEDGFLGQAPIDAYGPQTDTGFFNLLGNGWEWVTDKFTPGPNEPPSQEARQVLKGGSYVDSIDGKTNHRVRVTTRMGNTADSASDNMAFRCAVSAQGAHDDDEF